MATNPPVPPTLASLQAEIDQLRKEIGLQPLHNNATIYNRMTAVEGVPPNWLNRISKPLAYFCAVGAAGCGVIAIATMDPIRKAGLSASGAMLAGLATLFNCMSAP